MNPIPYRGNVPAAWRETVRTDWLAAVGSGSLASLPHLSGHVVAVSGPEAIVQLDRGDLMRIHKENFSGEITVRGTI